MGFGLRTMTGQLVDSDGNSGAALIIWSGRRDRVLGWKRMEGSGEGALGGSVGLGAGQQINFEKTWVLV